MRLILPVLMLQGCTFVLYDERCDTAEESLIEDTGTAPLLWSSLGAGSIHSCGLNDADEIACWGGNPEGQLDAPQGAFVSLAVGHAHSCALDVAGEVSCWGRNTEGQNDLSGVFDSISAGGAHTCGLDVDGVVTCVGRNGEGQVDVPEGVYKSISAGWAHTCAVTIEDKVSCWGDVSAASVDAPVAVMDSGQGFSCGLDFGGLISCWGDAAEFTDLPTSDVFVEIAAGARHLCARAEDGMVGCWGDNDAGQLDAPDGPVHGLVSGAGSLHSCAVDGLTDLGEARCWGLDAENQLMP